MDAARIKKFVVNRPLVFGVALVVIGWTDEIRPSNAKVTALAGSSPACTQIDEDDLAIADFAKAIQLDPKGKVQPHARQAADEYQRGVALAKSGKDGQAIAAYERAIQLAPKRFEYYKALDDMLSKRSEWQKAVSLWSQFITLVPDNGQVYCERGGAYSQLHDRPNFLKDGDKACSLGYQDCCENVKKLRAAFGNGLPQVSHPSTPPPDSEGSSSTGD